MTLNKTTIAVLTGLAITTSMSASANIRINGFGNLVGGINSDEIEFLGYSDDIDFSQDSLFGLQVSGDINDKMTATAQILSRGANDYSADFEWAYLSYKANENLTLTAGRFRLPLFNYSASLDVGYSQHWVSAPSTVYNVPFNNIDGFKVDYSGELGSFDSLASVSVGQFKGETLGTDITGKNTVLASYELSTMTWRLRGVYGFTDTTLNLLNSTDVSTRMAGEAIEGIAAVGFADLADNLRVDDDSGEFLGLSVSYDNFDYFASAEFTSIRLDDTFANDDDAFYVTAGVRLDKWTPSLTYEAFDSSGDVKYGDQITALVTSELPNEVKSALAGLATGIQLQQNSEYSIMTATLRYDYDANIAIKGEVSRLSDDLNSDNDSTLFRVGVNYVF